MTNKTAAAVIAAACILACALVAAACIVHEAAHCIQQSAKCPCKPCPPCKPTGEDTGACCCGCSPDCKCCACKCDVQNKCNPKCPCKP